MRVIALIFSLLLATGAYAQPVPPTPGGGPAYVYCFGAPWVPCSATAPLAVTPYDSTGAQVTWNNSWFPNGYQPSSVSATATAAVATATFSSNAKTVYITGISISGRGPAAVNVDCTISGVLGGTATFSVGVAITTAAGAPFNLTSASPLFVGTGNGVDVALSCPSFGASTGVSRLVLTGGTM